MAWYWILIIVSACVIGVLDIVILLSATINSGRTSRYEEQQRAKEEKDNEKN